MAFASTLAQRVEATDCDKPVLTPPQANCEQTPLLPRSLAAFEGAVFGAKLARALLEGFGVRAARLI